MRRVVVTGMGMVTPLGDGVDTNWRRLMAAESGIRAIQAFDTSDSMGRLVLNVLLTFAQFERELSSDRVRDKKAAMRKNGVQISE